MTTTLSLTCPDARTSDLVRNLAKALGCHEVPPVVEHAKPDACIDYARRLIPGLDWQEADPWAADAPLVHGSIAARLMVREQRRGGALVDLYLTVTLGAGSYRWMDDHSYSVERPGHVEGSRVSLSYRLRGYLDKSPTISTRSRSTAQRHEDARFLLGAIGGEQP